MYTSSGSCNKKHLDPRIVSGGDEAAIYHLLFKYRVSCLRLNY